MNFKEFINALNRIGITKKEYTVLEDLVNDANDDAYKDEYTFITSFTDEEDCITNQNTPYVTVFSKDKNVLNEVSNLDNVVFLDQELYVFPILNEHPYERPISFNDEYVLNQNEIFYTELDSNQPIYEFVKNDLRKFCKENKVDLHVESLNENGINAYFDIDEFGNMKTKVNIEGGKVAIEYYLYQMKVLIEMFGSTENLLECNPSFADINIEKNN